jgi:outer membrane protein OmpA-like peptidoglycan-associated protein
MNSFIDEIIENDRISNEDLFFDKVLGEFEASNTDTSKVQRTLNKILNLSLVVDGKIGTNTTRAIKVAQQLFDKRQTGKIADLPEPIISRSKSKLPYKIEVKVVDKFEFNKEDININHPPVIASIAKEIIKLFKSKKGNGNIILIGHTDRAGSNNYNRNLGLKRASSVAQHLHTAFECLGKNESEIFQLKKGIKWASAGEWFPIEKNRAARNRRVDVVILPNRHQW